LDFIEENYDQYQQGKKSEFYNTVSSKIITSKSPESIKGRLRRLLDKYEKVKQLNNKTGSGRTKWKWLEKMERIFGCRENTGQNNPNRLQIGCPILVRFWSDFDQIFRFEI